MMRRFLVSLAIFIFAWTPVVVMLAQFADAQHAKARTLKDAIKNAKTPSYVNKVVW